jgi:hypothetical protein
VADRTGPPAPAEPEARTTWLVAVDVDAGLAWGGGAVLALALPLSARELALENDGGAASGPGSVGWAVAVSLVVALGERSSGVGAERAPSTK